MSYAVRRWRSTLAGAVAAWSGVLGEQPAGARGASAAEAPARPCSPRRPYRCHSECYVTEWAWPWVGSAGGPRWEVWARVVVRGQEVPRARVAVRALEVPRARVVSWARAPCPLQAPETMEECPPHLKQSRPRESHVKASLSSTYFNLTDLIPKWNRVGLAKWLACQPHMVGHGLGSWQGHNKDHHKNGTNCLPARMCT